MTALLARIQALTGGDREVDGRIMFELFAKSCSPRGFIWPEDNPSWSFALTFSEPVSEAVKARARRDAAREHETPKEWIEWQLPDGRWLLMNDLRVPRLTESLDAALALVERVRPNARWFIGRADGYYEAEVQPAPSGLTFGAEGRSTPALALLAALLKSVEDRP